MPSSVFLCIKRTFFLLGCLAFSTQLTAQHSIGHTTITFQDPSRGNRNIQTEIYYPATSAGTNTSAAQGTFPVIVFGHGFVMAWDAYQNIWEHLVPRGYIMAFPRTEGNIFSTNHQAFGWDLQFLIQAIQNEGSNSNSVLFNAVHPNAALMGHSMGGGAAFLAADSLCRNGNINLKTLVGLAPAESSTNGVSSIRSAGEVTVPSIVFSGSQDGVTPPSDHHIPMYDSLASSCKTFINILGGAHCYFANANFNCDFGENTASTGISISRTDQHDVTFDFLDNWLDYYLKGICPAIDVFNDSLQQSARVGHNQVCNVTSSPDVTVNTNGLTLTSNQTNATYQWIDCNNNLPVPNETGQSYIGSAGGSYAVIVSNGVCSDTSACQVLTSIGVISIHDGLQATISPNPSSNFVVVQIGTLENYNYELQNISGQRILHGVHQNTTPLELSIQQLPAGVYFLAIKTTTQQGVYKIIRE